MLVISSLYIVSLSLIAIYIAYDIILLIIFLINSKSIERGSIINAKLAQRKLFQRAHQTLISYPYYNDLSPSDYSNSLDYPTVTIQLPVFNEGKLLADILLSITDFTYPKELIQIQVLDDSTDESRFYNQALVEEYQEKGYDIEYISRDNRDGFKAGALKNGLITSRGSLICIFDVDFQPSSDFLIKSVKYFEDSDIAMVQSKWGYLNESKSVLTLAQSLMLGGHFNIEQNARQASSSYINFNGTAGIWRKSAILDSGNWQGDTLTEDLDLSIRAQLLGWKMIYLIDNIAPSLLPDNAQSFKTQQFRWCKGGIETAKKILSNALTSNISLKNKVELLFHLTSGSVYLFTFIFVLLTPIVALKDVLDIGSKLSFDISGLFYVFNALGILTFIYYLVSANFSKGLVMKRILAYPYFIALNLGLSLNNTKGIIEALIGKKTGFIRTDKQSRPRRGNKIRFVNIMELVIGLISSGVAILCIYSLAIGYVPILMLIAIGMFTFSIPSFKNALFRRRSNNNK
ncbi:MAG: glycosyltransferase family 2 protein [Candidatus Kapaibacteriales bacterium]